MRIPNRWRMDNGATKVKRTKEVEGACMLAVSTSATCHRELEWKPVCGTFQVISNANSRFRQSSSMVLPWYPLSSGPAPCPEPKRQSLGCIHIQMCFM